MTQSKSHPKRRQRIVHSEATWRHHIDQWSDSGLSQSDYCEKHDLRIGSFSKWKSRLKKTIANKESPDFVPITIKSSPSTAIFEITFHDGVSLKVPSGLDPVVVLPWVNILRQLP